MIQKQSEEGKDDEDGDVDKKQDDSKKKVRWLLKIY